MAEYWQSDWYRAEKGLPPVSPPDTPSDDQLRQELAPYDGDPIAIRQHIDRRLHEAMEAQAQAAAKGDVQAARALVALTERRAKLLGLDAPKEIAVEVTRRRDPNDLKTFTTLELQQMYQEALAKERPAIQGLSTRESSLGESSLGESSLGESSRA